MGGTESALIGCTMTAPMNPIARDDQDAIDSWPWRHPARSIDRIDDAPRRIIPGSARRTSRHERVRFSSIAQNNTTPHQDGAASCGRDVRAED